MDINKKICASRENGKKGGRPKIDTNKSFNFKEAKLVSLTEKQYAILCNRYGESKMLKALKILNDWLESGSKDAIAHIGKNNYAYFRQDGWVINSIK